MTEGHSPLVQIVGRHFNSHFVACQYANTVLAHLSAAVSNELMTVFQSDTKAGIRQYFINATGHLD